MKQFLRFVVEWKTATALSYTAAVVIYTVVSLALGVPPLVEGLVG